MKKKIGDLTLREIDEICQKHYVCEDCPLLAYKIGKRIVCKHEIKTNNLFICLDQVIEVEEDE